MGGGCMGLFRVSAERASNAKELPVCLCACVKVASWARLVRRVLVLWFYRCRRESGPACGKVVSYHSGRKYRERWGINMNTYRSLFVRPEWYIPVPLFLFSDYYFFAIQRWRFSAVMLRCYGLPTASPGWCIGSWRDINSFFWDFLDLFYPVGGDWRLGRAYKSGRVASNSTRACLVCVPPPHRDKLGTREGVGFHTFFRRRLPSCHAVNRTTGVGVCFIHWL